MRIRKSWLTRRLNVRKSILTKSCSMKGSKTTTSSRSLCRLPCQPKGNSPLKVLERRRIKEASTIHLNRKVGSNKKEETPLERISCPWWSLTTKQSRSRSRNCYRGSLISLIFQKSRSLGKRRMCCKINNRIKKFKHIPHMQK